VFKVVIRANSETNDAKIINLFQDYDLSQEKEDHVPTVSQVSTQQIIVQRHVKHSYHICGDIRHKTIDCPKYSDMQNMFKNKGMKPIKKQNVVKPKISNPSIHMVDVNMAITKSKVTEK
jgi:hypothetical protein